MIYSKIRDRRIFAHFLVYNNAIINLEMKKILDLENGPKWSQVLAYLYFRHGAPSITAVTTLRDNELALPWSSTVCFIDGVQ